MRSHLVAIQVLLCVCALRQGVADEPVKILRGVPLPCEVDIPSAWKVVGGEPNLVVAVGDGMSIMLASSPEDLGDSFASVKNGYESSRRVMPDASWTKPEPVKLAGYEWLQYAVTATLQGENTTFLVYTYSGYPGTFSVTGVAHTAEFAQKRDMLIRIMRTFRFPKVRSAGSGDHP